MQAEPNIKLIQAIGRSGLRPEDLAYVLSIPEVSLLKVAAGKGKLSLRHQELLADILGIKRREIFI